MANLTFPVGVRLDPEVHRRLKDAALADGRKLSSKIAMICAEWVRNHPADPPEDTNTIKPVTDWMDQTPRLRTRRKKVE